MAVAAAGVNFRFAVDSPAFSDRNLRVEILATETSPPTPRALPPTLSASRRVEVVTTDGSSGRAVGPLADSVHPQKRQRVEENGTIEAEKARVQGSERLDDSPLGTPVLRVRVIPVSSVILALRSPFFQKLFMNGMKETNQKDITLRIAEIEEYALLELLHFMYTGDLETAKPTRVLQIMMAADKFQVADCMNHCAELLLKGIPMTTEFAMLYLDYPCSSSVETALKPVKTASKKFLAHKYRDIMKCQEELLNMTLSGIESIFSSSEVITPSEDFIFEFLSRWASAQYPEREERCQVWDTALLPLLRFSHMTCVKLYKLLMSTEIDKKRAAIMVLFELIYKAGKSNFQIPVMAARWNCEERAYLTKPVKAIHFDRPYPQCIAYMDLKMEDCSGLFPKGRMVSHAFSLARHAFT